MSLGGVISNILSLGTKLMPVIKASVLQAPSSSSTPPVEGHQIEAELGKLMRMLKRINATLYDAEQREIRDMSVKLWLKELKGVAYDAEDVLDEYHYEVLRAQVEARDASRPDSHKRKLIQVPDCMFNEIQQIRNKFAEIEKDRIALRLLEEDGPRRCNNELQIAPTSHLVNESDIFGRESEKEKLIDLLSSESHDGKVVSVVVIVGPGGLGKTTLAQLVYNDQKTRQRFDKFGWICVSEYFDVERLSRETVECITGNGCGLTNLSAMQEKISEAIRGKRVLLVLDDVWTEKSSLWDSFHAPFKSASCAKILVTTRNEFVARIMQTMPTFNLGYMSKEQCWRLFEHYAFPGLNRTESSELVEIGKKILKKCGMLPLSIKSIASLLRHEKKEESWREILESELWESDSSNEIFSPLQLSYARLPTHLKPCFIFCSMFPKDYEYNIKHLVQLWISQGYIDSKGIKTAEKIGLEYARQLQQRSFFESRVERPNKWHWFKLHDMIHDLARLNSKNGCCSIEAGSSSKFPVFQNELSHLYIKPGSKKLIELIPFFEFTTLRTLIIRGLDVENSFSTIDLSMTAKLRALEIDDCRNHGLEFLFLVSKLKHLRYLSLKNLPLERLAESICSLYNLQILNLIGCAFYELPTSIGNLVNLTNLVIERCPFLKRLPESLCQLKALITLNLHCEQLENLPTSIGNLVSLEKLMIYSEHLEWLPESLCQLKALRELALVACDKLEKLPSDIESLTNLQILKIYNIGVGSLPPSFNKFIGIRELKVKIQCQTIGWLEDFADLGGTLWLDGLRNLGSLNDVQCNFGRMHNLEHLKLSWDENKFIDLDGNYFALSIKRGHSIYPEGRNDFAVMARLQPHPNLRELDIGGYRGIIFPEWIGNPSSCASLEKIVISGCKNITFLPFGCLRELKYLELWECDSLQILVAESLPLELQELKIWYCTELISVPGIQKLKSLVELHINGCEKLHLLVINAQPSVELTARTNASAYRNSMLGLRNPTSLRSLKIRWCPQLQLLADELPCVESCEVEVEGCPLLREWCLQHGINYKE